MSLLTTIVIFPRKSWRVNTERVPIFRVAQLPDFQDSIFAMKKIYIPVHNHRKCGKNLYALASNVFILKVYCNENRGHRCDTFFFNYRFKAVISLSPSY